MFWVKMTEDLTSKLRQYVSDLEQKARESKREASFLEREAPYLPFCIQSARSTEKAYREAVKMFYESLPELKQKNLKK